MAKGLFGDLFDLNRDGKMDSFERAAEFQFLTDVFTANEGRASDDLFAEAGFDCDGLSWMDEDECREALEEAGLDLSDFDI